MTEHWEKIGYQPDSEVSEDVDEEPEIVVGNVESETVVQKASQSMQVSIMLLLSKVSTFRPSRKI